MTLLGFLSRLEKLREDYPTQVIVGFLHPDGLEVAIPMSPELFEAGAERAAGELLVTLHNDGAEDARRDR